MYKVFIHNKPVEIIRLNDPVKHIENTLVLRYFNPQDIEAVLQMLQQVPTIEKVILLCENPEEAFEALKKNSN